MGRKKHDKESIVETLRNLSQRLGKDTLSTREVQSAIPESALGYHFGNVGNALEAAGLKRTAPGDNFRGRGLKLSDNDLFESVFEVEAKLGREPGLNEYVSAGRFSNAPFKRFGKWPEAMAHYRKWKVDRAPPIDETESKPQTVVEQNPRKPVQPAFQTRTTPAQLYGEPIDFRGLRHAPINEQGVVYLFGMVSRELGFSIEALQQGFPDCEGKYLHDAGKKLWAKARIEFEFRASNFRAHGHDANQCDFIVCWVNDWPDCPLHVIELRSEILKLSSR